MVSWFYYFINIYFDHCRGPSGGFQRSALMPILESALRAPTYFWGLSRGRGPGARSADVKKAGAWSAGQKNDRSAERSNGKNVWSAERWLRQKCLERGALL